MELIAARGGIGILVTAEICQKVLYRFGMPAELALSMMVPIFKGKDDIQNCSCYGAVEPLEHGMKAVKIVQKMASYNSDC